MSGQYTTEQIGDLQSKGYHAGWIGEIRRDDEVAITTPATATDVTPPRLFTVTRIYRFREQPGGCGHVVDFVAKGEDGLEVSLSYDDKWTCYIRRCPVPLRESVRVTHGIRLAARRLLGRLE